MVAQGSDWTMALWPVGVRPSASSVPASSGRARPFRALSHVALVACQLGFG